MSTLNISDLSQSAANAGGALSLPTRAEKIFQSDDSGSAQGNVIASESPFNSDYCVIRLKGRSSNTNHYDSAASAEYRFLINPSQVQIQRQTVDAQTFTRGGWQIGLWGEDMISISLRGKTPGRYFTYGTTNHFAQFSQSYRNLAALELVFENNGYWFEGEQVDAVLNQQPRRIKMHEDVQLQVGEFIWSGLFDSLTVSEDANSPFLADFSLQFIAWKEEFVSNSPYPNSIGGEVHRGHTPPPVITQSAPGIVPHSSDTTISDSITDPEYDSGLFT